MFTIKNKKNLKWSFFSGITILAATFTVMAASSNAFPGKYKATLIDIEAANVINLYVDVWAGYPRSFRISLPGIAIPVITPKAPSCQLDMVQKAEELTRQFISEAKFIEVKDIRMENTKDKDATSDVYTDKGSLISKLKSEGLARPITTEPTKPWC